VCKSYILSGELVFIKLLQFLITPHSILIVYMNELNLRLASFDELSFHVAKDGDRRRGGHIHIVCGIGLLTKSWLSGR
jgi:hypothetical protein